MALIRPVFFSTVLQHSRCFPRFPALCRTDRNNHSYSLRPGRRELLLATKRDSYRNFVERLLFYLTHVLIYLLCGCVLKVK